MTGASFTPPTIDVVLEEFLASRREQLRPGALQDCTQVLELLRDSLDGYAYDSLAGAERRRWQEAYDADEETAFCDFFGPDKLIDHVDQFFGYFMVRKVMADRAFLHSAGVFVADLVRWLGERGYVDAAAVEPAADRAMAAAGDLPRADRLASLLYEDARLTDPVDLNALPDDEYVEEFLEITRVEPAALWFAGDIGPVPVSEETTRFAEVGWTVNIVLVRTPSGWRVLEVGNVYPA